MANEDVVKPENHELQFIQDHFSGIRHNYDLFPNHDYNSAFDQLLDTNLQIGSSCEDNEVWNQFQEHKTMVLQDSKEARSLDGNENDTYLYFPDIEDSGNSENDNKATVIGDIQKQELQEIDDNLVLGLDFTREVDMPPSSNPELQHCDDGDAGHKNEMVVGMEFSDVNACRRAMRNAAISLRFEMQTIKSDKSRFTAKCLSKDCPWRIHCAKLPNLPTFTIRTIHNKHTCGGILHLGHHQASAQWVAETVAEKIKENPNLKPKQILEEIHRVHGIALSYKQAWRGKERVMATIRGKFEEEYCLLPQYCEEIKRTNPGSVAVVHGNPIDSSFQQLFISFQASISGFLNACRPLIVLDKTILKSKYPGTLLLAAGFDGDGAVFPLAFAIVNEENESNWHRFLSELRKILEVNSEIIPKLTVLSTREKPIADGVEANFPTAFHGFCLHYLTERFESGFHSSILVNLLGEAAHALTVVEFKSKMNKIQQISPAAYLWIQNISPSLWATSYFEGTRFGQLTANVITESLNEWIQETSGLPIIQMMECIHRRLMDLFKERRETSSCWDTVLVPSAEKLMAAAIEESRGHRVYRANETEFEVMTHGGNVVVDIENRSCLCGRWQVYGLPCSHAVGALLACDEDVYSYVEQCFTVESYRRSYEESVEAVSEKEEWKRERDDEDVIRTPRALQRRKKRVRAEDRGRVKRAVRCGRCNQTGHFRTTCTAPV